MDALVKYCSVYQSIQEVKDDFLARIKPYVTSASKVTGKNAENEKLKILNRCFTEVVGWGFGSNQVPNQKWYATNNAMTILDGTAGQTTKTLFDLLPVKTVPIMDETTFKSRCLVKNLTWYDTNGNAKYTTEGFPIRKYDANGKVIKDYNIDFLIWKGTALAAGKEGDKVADYKVQTYAGLHKDGKMMVRVLATYLPYMIDNVNEIIGGELAIPPMVVRYEKRKDSTGKAVTLKDSSGNDLPKRRALLWRAHPGDHSVGREYSVGGISYADRFHIAPIPADRWTSPAKGKTGSLYDIKNWGTTDAPGSGFIRMCVRTSGTGAKEKIVDTKDVDYFCRSGRNYNTVTKLTSINHELMHVAQNFWDNGANTSIYMWVTEGTADLVNGGSKVLIQKKKTYSFGYDLLYGRTIENATVYKLKNKKLIITGYDANNNPVYETEKKNITINFDFILRTDTSEDEHKAATEIDGIGSYWYRAGDTLFTFLCRSVVNGWDQEWRQSHHSIKKDTAKAVAK